MSTFDAAIDFVLDNEGTAILDDPKNGEYSRYGITLKTAAALKLCAPDDHAFIQGMTADQAKDIYRRFWWDALQLGQVKDVRISTKILDMAVNMGSPEAVKLAQSACGTVGAYEIPRDGVMGPKTIAAINACAPYALLLELRAEALVFYDTLVRKNPMKAKYWAAWKTRAEK